LVAIAAAATVVVAAGLAAPASAGATPEQFDPARGCTVLGTKLGDVLTGTDGDDVICGGGGGDTISAGAGNDVIYGDDGGDTIKGGDGDDLIYGGTGGDTIKGGDGNDTILGGDGGDTIYGEGGDDAIYGGDGGDTIRGGAGNDTILGGAGGDTLWGENGNDRISGEDGADTLRGNDGDDVLVDGLGADTNWGDGGDDLIVSGEGSDTTVGGSGADRLFGEAGNDSITGGSGVDLCVGGSGANAFYTCETKDNGLIGRVEEDLDGDGLSNSDEALLGTDLLNADTDGDGLSDGAEWAIGLDPLSPDSDGDGTPDGLEDVDDDGLDGETEDALGTDPLNPDTDGDGIGDGDEAALGADPLNPDTDGDGAPDGREVEMGTDPAAFDAEFTQTIVLSEVDRRGQSVLAEATLHGLTGAQVDTGQVRPMPRTDPLVGEALPGDIGGAFDFTVDGAFAQAELRFALDESLWERDGFDPGLYWLDPETQLLSEVDGQHLDGRVLTATVEHFSVYIVLDLTSLNALDHAPIVPPDTTGVQALNVVFVNDISGSMDWSDPSDERAKAINAILDQMLATDRSGLVSFSNTARVESTLTSNETAIRDALRGLSDGGGTCGTCGLATGLGLFDRPPEQARRVVVFLTDGEDTTSGSQTYDQLIDRAKRDQVVIHTIGLGSGANSQLLKRIAVETGGIHQVGDAGDLVTYYEDIAEAWDTTDDNNDGIPDYYTKLMTDRTLYTGTGARVFGGATFEQVQAGGTPRDLDGNGRISASERLRAQADFDEDGITNGDEIEIVTRAAHGPLGVPTVYVKLKSSPASTDSDSDGYGDSTETANTTNAMRSDVDRYTLSNPDYVPVGLLAGEQGAWAVNSADANWGSLVSYGGRQHWFSGGGSGLTLPADYAMYMEPNGCGVVAAADLIAYTAFNDPAKHGLLARLPGSATNMSRTNPLAYSSYAELISQMTSVARPGGLNGHGLKQDEIRRMVNMYALNGSQPGRTTIVGDMRKFEDNAASADRKRAMLIEQLGRDVPVLWFYTNGQTRPEYLREADSHVVGADRLADRDRDGTPDTVDYEGDTLPGYPGSRTNATPNPGDNYFNLTLGGNDTFGNHFVNITELIVDHVDGTSKVVFSSWGRQMVADLDDTNTGHGGFFEVY
jgi:Mg-chelatase subunit ChlD